MRSSEQAPPWVPHVGPHALHLRVAEPIDGGDEVREPAVDERAEPCAPFHDVTFTTSTPSMGRRGSSFAMRPMMASRSAWYRPIA